MSSPQNALDSGRFHDAICFQCVPASTDGRALTQKSPGLAMASPKDWAQEGTSFESREMQ